MDRLSGKVCIITGTGGSIGHEAALLFAREGALVVGTGLRVEDAEATVDAVRQEGGKMVFLHPCDLSQVLFGSDYPYLRRDLAVACRREVEESPELNSEESAAVLAGNAIKLFPRLDAIAARRIGG